MGWSSNKSRQYLELEAKETVFIQMGHYTYTELSKSRFFLKDAIIKRWIEFSIDNYIGANASAVTALFYGLHMYEKETDRNSPIMQCFRNIAQQIFDPMHCIYCENKLRSFELDHFIPWSKLPVDRFWNLFPSCKTCNGKKTDKIVEMEDHINQRLKNFLNIWLQYFEKHQRQIHLLRGPQMEYLVDKSRQDRVEFLLEQIREINENLV